VTRGRSAAPVFAGCLAIAATVLPEVQLMSVAHAQQTDYTKALRLYRDVVSGKRKFEPYRRRKTVCGCNPSHHASE
jgi:hypothetical protein